jgi:hypothetical protein
MAPMNSTPLGVAAVFDENALMADLKTWWDEQAGKDDPFAPPKPAPGTIMDALPVVDSLAVVEALVVIDQHLPFEVHPTVIRPGGYDSFKDMTQDLLPKLQALMDKHNGKAKSQTKTSEKTHE